LTSPTNGVTYQPLDTTLNWTAGYGDPLFYKIYFGTTDPPSLVSVVGADVTTYDPPLTYNTTYFWKIVPFNEQGDATGCPVWSFSTLQGGSVLIGRGTDYQPRLPINTFYGYSYSQVIYQTSELGGPAQINSLAWYWNGADAAYYSNDWTIYLGHTTKSSFEGNMDWVPYASLFQVFTGMVELPAVPGWITVTLDTPFSFDGVHNLVVAVDENEPDFDGSGAGFHCSQTPDVRSLLYYSDATNPDPANPLSASYMMQSIANLVVLCSPLPNLAPLPPLLNLPPDSLTGLPLEGFELTWFADLNGGGLPDAYGVYISTDPNLVANPTYYAVTTNSHYNPVLEGGLVFSYSQQ
jgi:hypothetical protein